MINPQGPVGVALQSALADLISLELQCKQAHWNIKGERFRSLHHALDEVVDLARTNLDEVAERLATIGGTPDGRPSTVANTAGITEIPGGNINVDEAYVLMADKIQEVCDRIRTHFDAVGEEDAVSEDVLIGIVSGLEQQAWFLRASSKY